MDYTQRYEVAVGEAESLRKRRTEITTEIARLEALREKQTGYGKGKITREINPLLKELDEVVGLLKQAAPRPISPEEAYNYFKLKWQQELQEIDEALQKQAERFVRYPTDILERGEYITELTVRRDIYRQYLRVMEPGNLSLTVLHALLETTAYYLREFTADIMRLRGSNGSTNAYSTAVERDKLHAKAQWLEWAGRRIEFDLRRFWDGVVSYFELNPAKYQMYLRDYRSKKLWESRDKYNYVIATVWASNADIAKDLMGVKIARNTMAQGKFSEWENAGRVVTVSADSQRRREEIEEQFYEVTNLDGSF